MNSTHLIFLGCVLALLLNGAMCALPNFTIARCPDPIPKPTSDLWNKMHSTFSTPFVLASGSGYPIEPTIVYSCYADDYVYFKMVTQDDSLQSNFTGCNQPIYLMDALEAFFGQVTFTPKSFDPHHYIEFEVSPFAGFFYSNIFNPLLTCKNMTGDPQPCTGSGVTVYTGHNAPNWWAYLKIPWKILGAPGGARQMQENSYVWKGNFFRIDLLPTGRQYSCWSPTYSSPACFHKPKYFGDLVLEF